jgi:hypothetical protein
MYQPCTSTMYINTCTIPCTNNVSQPYTMPYAMYHKIYQASTINGVPQPSTNITKRCIPYMCYHIPSVFLNNVSISMTTIHHVSMLQEYAKNKHQECTITSSPCNQTRYQDTNTTKMYQASTRHASQACTIPSPSIRYNHISIFVNVANLLYCNSDL